MNKRIAAVSERLDHTLGTCAAQDDLDVITLGLTGGLENTPGHVVIASPDRIDLLEARQIVLHDLKGIVAVPVAVLGIQNLDVGIILHYGLEALHALVVDRRRDAPKHDNVTLTIEDTGQILGGYLGKAGIVTRNISILRADHHALQLGMPICNGCLRA